MRSAKYEFDGVFLQLAQGKAQFLPLNMRILLIISLKRAIE
jgi:hypothetical protein